MRSGKPIHLTPSELEYLLAAEIVDLLIAGEEIQGVLPAPGQEVTVRVASIVLRGKKRGN